MPCYDSVTDYAAIAELDRQIAAGERTVLRAMNGEVQISDWVSTRAAKSGWCEGCAMVVLATAETTSWATRSKLAAAGVQKGGSFVAASHNSHPHKVRR